MPEVERSVNEMFGVWLKESERERKEDDAEVIDLMTRSGRVRGERSVKRAKVPSSHHPSHWPLMLLPPEKTSGLTPDRKEPSSQRSPSRVRVVHKPCVFRSAAS